MYSEIGGNGSEIFSETARGNLKQREMHHCTPLGIPVLALILQQARLSHSKITILGRLNEIGKQDFSFRNEIRFYIFGKRNWNNFLSFSSRMLHKNYQM